MDFHNHSIRTLFQQLGLNDSNEAIDKFIQNHPLAKNINLTAAPFCSPAQATLLQEVFQKNADWAEIVDELDIRLLH